MAPADSPSARANAVDPVALSNRFEILPNAPLAEFNANGNQAYVARALKERRSDLMAIVCTSGVSPWIEVLNSVRHIEHPSTMRLLDHGVVDWTPEGRRRYVLIFDKPPGRRLMNNLGDTLEPMNEDNATRLIIQPLAAALKEFASRGIGHSSVRPSNMFMRDIGGSGVVLGEGVSSLPGVGQPVLIETVERGLAQPSGRGPGTIGDDLYALGVSVVILMLGRNPLKHLDDDGVLQLKIERGSYPALASGLRLSLGIMEPLRGLLSDDPKQRWTLNDLELWLSGRRLSPKQPHVARRGSRPLEFDGQEYWHCRSVARAMSRNTTAAAHLIESGELDRWLRRSLNEEPRAEAVASAIEVAAAGGRAPTYDDKLVSRVCVALDPTGPIRYKGRSVMPDGIGAAMMEALMKGESGQTLAEIIGYQIPMFWVNMQPEFRAEFVPMIQAFDVQKSFLERGTIGFGIERVLYEMNTMMPCISPVLTQYCPMSVADVLDALDTLAKNTKHDHDPLDRHIAAFLAARTHRVDEKMLAQLSVGIEAGRRITAQLTILSDVQRRNGAARLPHLAAWMVGIMEPTFHKFHNRKMRGTMKQEAEKYAREGDLSPLLRMVDNSDAQRRDEVGFLNARKDYYIHTRDIGKLRAEITDKVTIEHGIGRQVAALVSSVVASLLSLAILGVTFMRH
ncbi:MAG: serine/threonine-protein kinase [Azospirillaceae bacterium]|nr:serine/threonine-protein kinase [Azospirillaceae bacterium]